MALPLLLLIILLTASRTTLWQVKGFVIPNRDEHYRMPLHSPLQLGSSTPKLRALQAFAAPTTELWLDLRGTKLSPTEAKDRLERDLGFCNFVDRIIIDDAAASVSFSTASISSTSTSTFAHPPIGIIHQQHDNMNDRPILVGLDGLIVTLPASGILIDPMPALDAILNSNNKKENNDDPTSTTTSRHWVVLLSEPGEPRLRQEGISSLVPLLAGVAATVGGGGRDASNKRGDAATSTNSRGGGAGVAWTCQTKSDILHAGMVVQSLERVESTQGGILLSSPLSSLAAAGDDDTSRSSTLLQCALLLPFDQVLWQTALKFFRESTDDEEGVGNEYDFFDNDNGDMLSISRDDA